MKTRILFHMMLAVCVAALATTGCKHRAKGSAKSTQPAEAVAPLGNAGEIASADRPLATGNWEKGQFAAVYFDFDSAAIRPGEVSKLEAAAAAMKSNPGKLVVEGHADERGTSEYNRALGERRAQAAREQLIKLGVSADKISTVSYGEERPADPGHDEAAWSKNRRCEFVVVSQ